MHQTGTSTEAIVVGGGLAGLTAAAYLARAGRRVTLIEKAREIGGRARTAVDDGFSFNLGPHAVYLAGRGAEILRELGIPYEGGQPGGGSFLLRRGRMHTLPEGFVSLVSTGLFGVREKLELARWMGSIARVDTSTIAHVRFADWLAGNVHTAGVRELLSTITRVATYTHPTDDLSAAAAVSQLQLALERGVRYVHGGWQTLADALRDLVRAAGGEIVSGVAVRSIVRDTAVRGVLLDGGRVMPASAVVLAGSPQMVADLTGISQWAESMQPVRMSSLDVALRALPKPGQKAVFGMNEPLYGSVHSAVARLAPGNGAVIHMARYGGLQGRTPQQVRTQLEELLDQFQPGWRGQLVKARFLPDLIVTHAAVLASQGGFAGRPSAAATGIPGLYLAGDWVGPEGMLADAGFASGHGAAKHILEDKDNTPGIPLDLASAAR